MHLGGGCHFNGAMSFAKRPLLSLAIVAAAALAGTGCFLISADFEGDVNVLVDFLETDDNTYSGVERVDPNDYEDYADNRDRIEEGEIIGIDVTFVDVPSINDATYARGRIDVKRADAPDSEYILAVGEWSGVNIVANNRFPVPLTAEGKAQVDEILFGDTGPIDLRITGETDTATIAFTAQITVRLRFTAGI